MKSFIFLIAIVASLPSNARTFRIAAIYPMSTPGHINCTCGSEAACITRAAITDAQKAGMNVSIHTELTDRSIFGAVEAANRVAMSQYDAVLGTFISSEAIPVSDVLEKAGIPFIAPTATNPQVTAGKKFSLRIPFNDFRQSKLLARLAVTEFKVKRIAVIRNSSNSYSEFLGLQFPKEVLAIEPSVKISQYPTIDGFNNYRSLITEIMSTSPDLIFVPLTQEILASVYSELIAYNKSIILLGSDTIEGKPQFMDLFGNKPTKIKFVFPKHWDEKLNGSKAKRYLKLHQQYCSQYQPSMVSVASYDAAELLLSGLREKPSARAEELISTIRSLRFDGVTGPIVYGKDGDPIKPIELFELKSNNSKYWKRYE